MSRKTTAALVAALGINFALAGGALMLANLNKPLEYDADAGFAAVGDIESVAGVAVDAASGDLAVPLAAAQRGGNARVTFTCGKSTPSGREDHEGTWEQVGGAVLYHPDSQSLRAVEAVFDTRSLRTDASALTATVTTNEKWFDIDNHPLATFTCDNIKPLDAASSPHTHELVGKFTLNGITQPLAIPCKLAFSGQTLAIDAQFTILRSDYKVDKREGSLAGAVGGVVSEVDDEVKLAVRVTASPDPAALIAELAKQLQSQEDELASITAQLKQATSGINFVSQRTRELETKIDDMKFSVRQSVDTSDVPARYTETIQAGSTPKLFDMLLVPGDKAKGIGPFYIATHEARWEMLTDWIYTDEISEAEAAREVEAGFRPSKVWGTLAQQFQVGDPDNPAMGMTRLTAEAYCKWLSEKTGRRYRLPTHDEWMHAFDAGGGMPGDLDALAWHAGNAVFNESVLKLVTGKVGSKKPNGIGIYDMLGNVAEWVTGTGEQKYIVGGSIGENPDEITRDWKAVEDFDVWSASYPNLPISRYWYVDYYFSGIRLVCEPASVAANPPKGGE